MWKLHSRVVGLWFALLCFASLSCKRLIKHPGKSDTGTTWFLLPNRLHKRKWQLLQRCGCCPILQTREEETFREAATPRVRAEAAANSSGSWLLPAAQRSCCSWYKMHVCVHTEDLSLQELPAASLPRPEGGRAAPTAQPRIPCRNPLVSHPHCRLCFCLEKSKNHRILWVEGTFKVPPVPPLP